MESDICTDGGTGRDVLRTRLNLKEDGMGTELKSIILPAQINGHLVSF